MVLIMMPLNIRLMISVRLEVILLSIVTIMILMCTAGYFYFLLSFYEEITKITVSASK
jgi:type IV secretory pathway VirB6-like protein